MSIWSTRGGGATFNCGAIFTCGASCLTNVGRAYECRAGCLGTSFMWGDVLGRVVFGARCLWGEWSLGRDVCKPF